MFLSKKALPILPVVCLLLVTVGLTACGGGAGKEARKNTEKNEETRSSETEPELPETDGRMFTWDGTVITGLSEEGMTCTELMIPKKATEIRGRAFENCRSLTSVTIPSSVTSIGSHILENCSSLMSVTVNANNPVYHSAGNCVIQTETKELILGCKNSTIPSDGSVTSIGESAFSFCGGLMSVTIPEGVTSIKEAAFAYCGGLTSVTIPEGVTSIESSVFYGCSGLTSVTIPESVTSIENSAFYGCSGLTSVTIPSSISSIGNNAFHACTGITSVTIPEGVTSIGIQSFLDCSSLTSVTISSSVTSIGETAFAGCRSLTSITVDANNPVYRSAGNCLIQAETKTLLLGCKNSEIPSDGSVTSIGVAAFYGCGGLTSVTIPSSVTSIGNNAFMDCSNLTEIRHTGTQAQWAAIQKGSKWNNNTGEYVVICTDGEIAK